MIFNYNRVYNYQFCSVVQPSSSLTRTYFPDLPNLRDVYTIGIVLYNNKIIAQDPGGFTISAFASNQVYVTLVEGNVERFQKLDGATLNPLSGYFGNYSNIEGVLSIKPTKFDFSKSYIEFVSGFVPTANQVIPFGIYYLYPNQYKELQP